MMSFQREQQQDLIIKYGKIIDACNELLKNSYWQDLVKYLVADMVREIENRLQFEKDLNSILRYQGEWAVAKKFADLRIVADLYDGEMRKLQLNNKK